MAGSEEPAIGLLLKRLAGAQRSVAGIEVKASPPKRSPRTLTASLETVKSTDPRCPETAPMLLPNVNAVLPRGGRFTVEVPSAEPLLFLAVAVTVTAPSVGLASAIAVVRPESSKISVARALDEPAKGTTAS